MKTEYKLTVLTAIFVGGLLGANTLGSKVITYFGMTVSVGILAYPLTFLVTDAVGEVFGKTKAKQIVYAALIAQVFVLLLTYLAIKLPPAERFTMNPEYVKVFNSSLRMIIASLTSFIISQTFDIWAFDWFKKKTKGKFLWLRNNASTMTSQAIDTLLFMFIAFYHITPKFTTPFILQLCLSYWLFKVAFAVADTPFVYMLVKWLKKNGDYKKLKQI